MKLTEAKLKKLINEVLEEGMNTASMLPDDVYVLIMRRSTGLYVVAFANEEGRVIMPWTLEGVENDVYGDVSFYTKSYDDEPCGGGSIIAVTEAADGWGPLLYDIAMEAATIMTKGLAPDRNIVSDDASEVWDYYDQNRTDVKKKQLDDEYGSLTPDEPEDDCGQESARDRSYKMEDWPKSSLSRMYSKDPTTLNQLRDADKLILKRVTLDF
jgi:hypothetical protein